MRAFQQGAAVGRPLRVPHVPVAVAVEFLNEWAAAPQEASRRPWLGYPAADSGPRRALRSVWPLGVPEPDNSQVARACDLVYPVFTAEWPEGTAERLDSAIALCGMAAHVGAPEGEIRLEWRAAAGQLMPAVLVASVLGHLATAPLDRLGICESAACADVLVDRSPAHTKHFCSERCQTRERVRAHRARTR
ncbi:MAG: CGNR zinc finger domain-containing protein [Bifidobacteriaceae bacterium]|jgi:hypothetical protein|nr:CGNR zinc finger domain-containing protein [Bifidobacteriaceae bacterium]